jgi:hypothetical protein
MHISPEGGDLPYGTVLHQRTGPSQVTIEAALPALMAEELRTAFS